jgi:hypothetical protein
VSGVEEDENFFKEIQDIKLIHELGVQTWIAKKNIHSGIMNNLFMVKISEAVEANYINETYCAK